MILEIDNVELGFGNKRILHGIYLRSETNQVTGILGRNGSGKTCLLKILFGSLNPKTKNIRIDNKVIQGRLFEKNLVAYLPQHRLLPKPIKLKTAFKWFCIEWNDFLEQFEPFGKYQNMRAGELSSGELRLVETYLILNSKKKIILLDEPFSFIAPLYMEKIKNLIIEKKQESTIIVTDHFYRDILDISNRLYFLKDGFLSKIGSKESLEDLGYINASINQEK